MQSNLTVIILTYNESAHIKRCIESVKDIALKIVIVDSFSVDNTVEIAKSLGAEIYQNIFVNQSIQMNWALDNIPIDTDFIMRIDADEYIDDELKQNISIKLPLLPQSVTGVYLNRYIKFMGDILLHGGMSSYWILRIWRNGFGRCEQRWMDEHIILSGGDTTKANGKLIDDNLNNLSWWSHKHVDYSTREAIDILSRERDASNNQLNGKWFGSKAERTRFFKKIYNKTPLFVRPFFYFFYRYFMMLGFLDGVQGFLWCILQGFWYRFMVDAKVYEIKKTAKELNIDVVKVIKDKYGYEV